MSHRAPVLLVLFLLSLSGSAASSFGPEVAVTPPVPTVASSFQSSLAAAPNGEGFLAAWWDSRAHEGVYTGRIDANGNVIDRRDLFVTDKSRRITMTVLGRDTLLADVTCSGEMEVFRIDESNAIVDSATFGVNTSGCPPDVSMATNGETIILVYGGNVAVLDADLDLVSRDVLDVSAIYSAVASDGRDFVVVTAPSSSATAQATHLDHRGIAIGTNAVTFPSPVESLDIASDGTDYLAVAGGSVLGAARLGASGEPVGAATSVAIDTPTRGANRPRIEWDGGGYAIVYNQQFQLSAPRTTSVVRVDRDANRLASRVIGGVSEAAIATRPGRVLVLSAIVNATAQALDAETLSPVVAQLQPIAYATPEQSQPKLVDAGGTRVVFWIEKTLDDWSLKAKPLTEGATQTTLVHGLFRYSVAFDGTNFVVLFDGSSGQVAVQRFRPDLTPVDNAAVTIGSFNSLIQSVAAAGDGRLLIAWMELNASIYEVKTREYDTTGPSLLHLATATVSVPPYNSEWPAVAWSGTDFLVTWAQATSAASVNPPPTDQLFFRHVARDGSLIEPLPVLFASPKANVVWTSLASNGGKFYEAWTQRDAAGHPVLAGKTVDSIDDPDILSDDIDLFEEVAPFGNGFVVSWGAPAADLESYSPTLRLIDAAGKPGATYSLPPIPKQPDHVSFASGTVAYVRAAAEPELGGTLRVFTRSFAPAVRRRGATSF